MIKKGLICGNIAKGKRLVDAGAMGIKALQGVGAIVFEKNIFLVVDVTRQRAVCVFLYSSSQGIVAVAGCAAVRKIDLNQLILGVVGGAGDLVRGFVGLCNQIAVGIVGVIEVVLSIARNGFGQPPCSFV